MDYQPYDTYQEYQPQDPIKAVDVEGLPDAFDPEPLESRKAMEEFYVETMAVRTGDPEESPIWEIEYACAHPRERNVFLLLGHRGCGKSTELNRMKLRLQDQGRPVRTIQCGMELQLINKPEYSDLLILMADALLRMSEELGVDVAEDTLRLIRSFWMEGVRTVVSEDAFSGSAGAGLTAASPALIRNILNLFVEVKGNVKYNQAARVEYKERLTGRFSDWLTVIRRLSDGITAKAGKQPVLIFEGLDKMDSMSVRELFFRHPNQLSSFSFPVIYTFPATLSYDTGFPALLDYFQIVRLPMIHVHNIDNSCSTAGFQAVREIVWKRTNALLINEDALTLMIEKTGGCLRDLFRVICDASFLAENRAINQINIADAQRALLRFKSSITRLVYGDDHEFLAEIYNGKRREIFNKEKLLKNLQARTLLEYTGERWYNVHPLVADYLKELGYVQ